MTTETEHQGERSIGRRCRGDAKVSVYDETTRRWSSYLTTVEGVIREAHGSSRGGWSFLVEDDEGQVFTLLSSARDFRLLPVEDQAP